MIFALLRGSGTVQLLFLEDELETFLAERYDLAIYRARLEDDRRSRFNLTVHRAKRKRKETEQHESMLIRLNFISVPVTNRFSKRAWQ